MIADLEGGSELRVITPRMMRWTTLSLCTLTLSCSSVETSSSDDSSAEAYSAIDTGTPSGADCHYPLVRFRTSEVSDCFGGNEHRWPVGTETTDCHGWRAFDHTGGARLRSANDIHCNADGSFQFTEFENNLSCEGVGITKVYIEDECESDSESDLYTVAVDLTCCTHPDSPQCVAGIPSVSGPGSEVILNGMRCE